MHIIDSVRPKERYNQTYFMFHEYFVLDKNVDKKEIHIEFSTTDKTLVTKWNLKRLEILDLEKN